MRTGRSTGSAMSSRPASRVINDSMSESVDLLQMLIAPPPPPPPASTSSRPVPAQPHQATPDDSVTGPQPALQRAQQPCYRACHACAVEEQQQQQRYRQQLHSQQAAAAAIAECACCSCSHPRVDPRPASLCSADRDDTASIYFSPPRGPLPPPGITAAALPWSRRPAAVKARGPGDVVLPRHEPSSNCAAALTTGARCSAVGVRRADDVVDDTDECCYDDLAGKRTVSTMSTSLSSRASSRTPAQRSATDICRRVRCYFHCWTRRRTNSHPVAVSAGDPQSTAAATDFDLCIQAAHEGPCLIHFRTFSLLLPLLAYF